MNSKLVTKNNRKQKIIINTATSLQSLGPCSDYKYKDSLLGHNAGPGKVAKRGCHWINSSNIVIFDERGVK